MRSTAAQGQPRTERRQHRAGDVQTVRDAFKDIVRARECQRAAQDVAVAAEIFGGRMHDDVRAQRQRLL